MKNKIFNKTVKFINHALKADANSTSTVIYFQPKAPKNLDAFKSNILK